MLGIQFVQVGQGEAMDLSTFAALNPEMAGFDADGNFATELQVWNGLGYDMFGWSGTSGTDVLDNSDLDNKWLNGDLELTDDVLDKAEGVWVKAGSAGTATIAGQVPSEDTITVNLRTGWNMVANPYPGQINVTDFGVLSSGFPGFDADGNFAVELQVWNGLGYDMYGWSGTSGTDVLDNSDLDNKWLNGDLEESDGTVLFGHGVWIKTDAAGTITFTNPAQ